MEVESQIEQESKIRDGALRLIQAATTTKQSMEAAKSLMTSNARLLALMSRLQKSKKEAMLAMETKKRCVVRTCTWIEELSFTLTLTLTREAAEREPCKAKVTISGWNSLK